MKHPNMPRKEMAVFHTGKFVLEETGPKRNREKQTLPMEDTEKDSPEGLPVSKKVGKPSEAKKKQ